MALGAVGAGASRDTGLARISALTAVGAGAGLVATRMNDDLSALEKAKIVPESHLYSGAFAIPPGLHTKKWVTLSYEEPLKLPYLRDVEVQLKLKSGETHSFKIPFVGRSMFPAFRLIIPS